MTESEIETTTDAAADLPPSPSFEPYASVLARVQDLVRRSSLAAPRRSKDKTEAINDSDSQSDGLGWESEEDSSAAEEELLEFRSDLPPVAPGVAPDTAPPLSPLNIENTAATAAVNLPTPSLRTAASFESEFRHALATSSMIVDFQEHYIHRRLAAVREASDRASAAAAAASKSSSSPATTSIAAAAEATTQPPPIQNLFDTILASMALSASQHTIAIDSTNNPENDQLDIDDTDPSDNTSALRSNDHRPHKLSIQPHHHNEHQHPSHQNHGIELSAQSRAFARFIPSFAPTLCIPSETQSETYTD